MSFLQMNFTYAEYNKLVRNGEIIFRVSVDDKGKFITEDITTDFRKETSKTSDAAKSVDVDKRGSWLLFITQEKAINRRMVALWEIQRNQLQMTLL